MANYQGYPTMENNGDETINSNQGFSGHQVMGGSAGDGMASALTGQPSTAHPPGGTQTTPAPHSGHAMPNSGGGSITQYYSHAPSHFAQQTSPQVIQGNGYQQQVMYQTVPHQNNASRQQQQQHLSTQQQILSQQSNQYNPSQKPQYPQYPQNVTSDQTTDSEGGSYAARSAQAFASMGSPATSNFYPTAAPAPLTPSNQAFNPQLSVSVKGNKYDDAPSVQAQQNRILTDCTRKVQEHAYYMKQAMDKGELATVLDRASQMVGELGDLSSGNLTPKNYYELYMRALDDMPNLEDYFLSLAGNQAISYSMKNIYEHVQYCPRVLSRLYLQISAGSALIRSKEDSAQWVLNDLIDSVKCVQNPLRGLFLRHFLLQATRDKLPDGDTVQDAYEFVLANFIEMNKLWVRIQHLPGDGKTKDQRKKRERERNELRILVGTNLVRLSQLEGVSSKIYGDVILPKILEQITVCGDPLAQAYLIDCIIQVFPDEYHIETLPILLAVCPKLRDKVNIRTIMQSLMDRLANFYAEEELLDEKDTNEVKKSVAQESFPLFEECVQKVYHARGPKLVSKEVIRLQTALLNFSLKCFPGNMDQVSNCLGVCLEFIRQAATAPALDSLNPTPVSDDTINLDEASVSELQKMLSVPLDSLALKVLQLKHYSALLKFLPLESRRDVGMTMLRAIDSSGDAPTNTKELKELFNILQPVIQGHNDADLSSENKFEKMEEENNLVSKLIYLLENNDLKMSFEMLTIARSHLRQASGPRLQSTLVPVVFAAFRILRKVDAESNETQGDDEQAEEKSDFEKSEPIERASVEVEDEANSVETTDEVTQTSATEISEKDEEEKPSSETLNAAQLGTDGVKGDPTDDCEKDVEGDLAKESPKSVEADTASGSKVEKGASLSIRDVFLFIQSTIAMLSSGNPELGLKLYLIAAQSSDNMAESGTSSDFLIQVTNELLTQGFALYDDEVDDCPTQQRCIVNMVGTLLSINSIPNDKFERFTTKLTQFAAKLMRKQDQCRMVLLCSNLFYAVGKGEYGFKNPKRTLECLQRSLKLADASAMSSSSNFTLFVDLLEQYLYFFEENNPVITDAYVSGLIALIGEHLDSLTNSNVSVDGQAHFNEVLEYIKRKKSSDETAERFAQIKI
mmetsp:Transcript_28049/g.42774  ORF Transcript_28049/g.42774 Transcript_28049/m.42774 type:complete len:1139 (+) Transcript_28049:153-3569(+)